MRSARRAHTALVGEPLIYALFGPTGVGKTAVALALAERLRELGEDPVAVSADAMQVYAGLEVLTGAPSARERAALEHRLVSFVDVGETFSAGRYAQLAHAEIDDLLAAGRRPIVVGGTGLYLRAALASLDLLPPPRAGVRERLQAELSAAGAKALHARLAAQAPWAAATLAPTDGRRVVRALEALEAGALDSRRTSSQLWSEELRVPTLLVGLTMARAALYARIDERVEEMLRAGAAEEVRRANDAGASQTARKALGFEELLGGEVEEMKRHTRQYARRQLTWMRKLAGVHVIDVTELGPAEVAAEILDCAGG
jgi:tRNA dimethylallyltransferase